jgi:glycosyltransferase involved in cell wall biosynthesis
MKLYKDYSPSVSVILPTFNREELITRAIDSVIRQEYTSWELLVIDDGSEDDTFEIIRDYQNKFENIRYCRHSNRKLPLSLNAGIQLSTGEYISFLGSDDEYLTDHLMLRIKYMIDNPGVDLIHGGVQIIGDPYVKDKNNLSKKIHLSECTIGGTFLGKKQVFTDLKGFKNINYSEDSEFLERAKTKYEIRKVSFPTYIYYRDTPGSICNSLE